MFNLGGVVAALATETVTVTRFLADAYDSHGRANPRAVGSSITPKVSVQPTAGADMKHLPEGISVSETVAIWSPLTLKIRDRVAITSRGASFEVFHVDPWEGGGNYCKALARRLGAGEPHP